MRFKDAPKLPLFFIALMFASGALAWGRLPDRIPTHWGPSGAIDAWADKSLGSVFAMPLLALGLYALLLVMPYLDPRRRNLLASGKAYGIVIDLVIGVEAVVFASTLAAAFDNSFAVDRVVMIAVGVMFVVIGNYMTTVKQNWTFGVRLAWTLSDEVVWRKTNRLGGWLFVGAGLCSIAGTFLPPPWNIIAMLVPLGIILVVTYVYSLVLYKRRHPEESGPAQG